MNLGSLKETLRIRFPEAERVEISNVHLERTDPDQDWKTVVRLRLDHGPWFDYTEPDRELFDLFGDTIAPAVADLPRQLGEFHAPSWRVCEIPRWVMIVWDYEWLEDEAHGRFPAIG